MTAQRSGGDPSNEHVARLARLQADDFVDTWFESWRSALGVAHEGELAPDVLPLRETILEAVSDASAEQFLTPLTARHMRRFGRAHFSGHDLRFWVRSEWGKVDLCYGLAPPNGFPDWNLAWETGETGDLGQIEVKVIYAHEAESKRRSKLEVLSAQLADRSSHRARPGPAASSASTRWSGCFSTTAATRCSRPRTT